METRGVPSASLSEIEDSDAVVILGEDIWNIAPVMALAVRQSVMRTSAAKALEKTQLPVWHDIAVKELVQEDKGFLANISIYASPLDDIATFTMRAAPEDLARVGFAIANLIDTSSGEVTELDTAAAQLAGKIADVLNNCKRPVIISGSSSCSEAVVSAAYNIALALQHSGKKSRIAFALPECNSMGLAIMRAPSLENAMRKLTREQDITAVILEQDLYRYLPGNVVDEFMDRCKHIIALDSLHNATTQKANVLIPASTFAEADGTLVNYEGRAQRFYQVMMPGNSFIAESWKWLKKMKSLRAIVPTFEEPHPEEMLASLEGVMEKFKGISKAAPPRQFRIHGEYIPRETHRYSGRTAMFADKNVSEDKPYSDGDSPLSFTMEGYQGIPPPALIPFFWSPGWNSVQATNKYQEEVGGALKGGDPGVRLFENNSDSNPSFYKEHPEPFRQRREKWLVIPRYHVFGSDELSVYTKGVRELSPEPYIGLSPSDASRLGVAEKGIVTVSIGAQKHAYPLKIFPELTNGIVLLPKGLSEMHGVAWGSWAEVYADKMQTAKA